MTQFFQLVDSLTAQVRGDYDPVLVREIILMHLVRGLILIAASASMMVISTILKLDANRLSKQSDMNDPDRGCGSWVIALILGLAAIAILGCGSYMFIETCMAPNSLVRSEILKLSP